MIHEPLILIYFSILVAIAITSLFQFRQMDKGLQIFSFLIWVSLFVEIAGRATKYFFDINMSSHFSHFFSVIELSLTGLFFVYTVKKRLPIFMILTVCAASAMIGFANWFFFQPLATYNTNVLIVECLLIASMAMYGLYSIVLQPDVKSLFKEPSFLVWAEQLLIWTATFFFWAFSSYLKNKDSNLYDWFQLFQLVVNIAGYLVILYAFLIAKFQKPSNFRWPQKRTLLSE